MLNLISRFALALLLISSSWKSMGQVPIPVSSNLPLVFIQIDGGQAVVDEPKRFGNMKIVYRGAGQLNYAVDTSVGSYLNYNGRVGIERRGSSSQWSSNLGKFSFGFETITTAGANNNVSLLGMPKENDWILNAFVYDKTLIRNALSAEVSRRMGRKAMRSHPCEVILNGEYIGVYHLVEKIKRDDNRIDVHEILNTDNSGMPLSGGYIYKIDKASGTNNANWSSAVNGYNRYQYHFPDEVDITVDQKNYLKGIVDEFETVMNSTPAVWQHPLTGYAKYIDVLSFTDQHLLHELAGNLDMLASSMYYFKDRGGKITAGPIWDHDLGYGNNSGYDAWRTDVFFTNRGQSLGDGPFYYQKLMFQDMNYRCMLAQRWQQLRVSGGPLNQNVLFALIDSLAAPMVSSNSREQAKYGTLGSNYFGSPAGWQTRLTYQSEIDYLKTWLSARLLWLDANLPYAGACNTDVPTPLVINEIMYNPIGDGTTNGDQKFEYIEIKNAGNTYLNLQGYFFSEGISYVFPSLVLAPDSFAVIASDSLSFITRYGFAPDGQYYRPLSNKSKRIILSSPRGTPIDTVEYFDTYPWPYLADGFGRSLELKSSGVNNMLSTNWFTRNTNNGSPGVDNNYIDSCTTVPTVIITEINNHNGGGITPNDWVEIYNPGPQGVNLAGWTIRDGNQGSVITSGIMPPNSYRVICRDTSSFKLTYVHANLHAKALFTFGLDKPEDLVILENAQGCLIDYVNYKNLAPWPMQQEGDGLTLKLNNTGLDNVLGSSWSMSTNQGGSPGYANSIEPPHAAFTSTISNGSVTNLPLTLNLDASGSTDNQSIISYDWYVDDVLQGGGQQFSVTLANSGEHKIVLKIKDSEGIIDTEQETWNVGKPPVARIQANPLFNTTQANFTFDGQLSEAFNGQQIISYTWYWGNGIATDTGVTVQHQFNSSGAQLVGLKVVDNAGLTDSTYFRVFVKNAIPDTLIATNEFWQYLDNGSNQQVLNPGWKSDTVMSPVWPNGKAELGYGDGDETTVVSYGSSASNKYVTTYFRKLFTIDSPALYQQLKLDLKCDDGAVVYLNGQEIARSNLPNGSIGYQTYALIAISGTNESAFNPFFPTGYSLQSGTNVLAVEVHQSDASSSDISFDLRLTAQRSSFDCSGDSSTIVINEIGFPGTNTGSDWIELYNADSSAVDVSGWVISQNNTQIQLPDSLVLAAGSYTNLTHSVLQFQQQFNGASATQTATPMQWNPLAQTIILRNAKGCVMDSVSYTNITPWPQIPTDTACSIALLNETSDNAQGLSWELRKNNGVTPGLSNVNVLLDQQAIDLTVWAKGKSAAAKWTYSNPDNFEFTGIEYLSDQRWMDVYRKKSHAGAFQFDYLPLQEGMNYYRVYLIKPNQEKQYSEVKTLQSHKNQEQPIVSPNPFDQVLRIYLPMEVSHEGSARMYDISGRIVWQSNIVEGLQTMSTEKLASGWYLLEIKTADHSWRYPLEKR